ncbi:hypothetical protein Tco_0309188 [Tanacetum coccineum]
MSSLAENVLAVGAENRPPILEKGNWQFEYKVVTFPANEATRRQAETRMQTFKDLTPEEKSERNVKELIEEIELTKQERESKLANEFDIFTSEKGEMIQSCYMRFVTEVKQAKNLHEVSFDQLYAYLKQNEPDANEFRAMKARFPDPLVLIANTYNPPPSYSSYKSQYNPPMLVVAQQQPYIPQLSYEPPVVYQQPFFVYQQPLDRPTSPDSGFAVPSFLPTDDIIASLNKAMMFLTTAISSRYPLTNNQLKTSSNPRTQANIQDERVVVQNIQDRQALGYTGNAGRGKVTRNTGIVRTVRDLNANPPKAWIEIDAEQQDFLADGLEGFDSDCEDLQLNATSILMTEKVDAYDSEVDDAPTASEIFMAKLSPAGSINGDEVGSSYDSDIVSEVPNYDTYHANDMFNPFVQELPASEQLVLVNDTYVDFISDSNVIFDTPYSENNKNEFVQGMTSLAQNDVAILPLIENTKYEVTRCNTVNLESKQVNEQLTIELD